MDSGIVNFLLSALPYLIALLVLVSIARAFCFFKSRTTNKQLKEREQLLYTLINEIPDPLVLKDHKGNFLLANQACATLYNTTPEAMVGKHDGDFGVPKEQADFFRQNVLNIMAKGETEVVFEDSTDVKAGMTRHYKSIKKPFKTTDGLNQILVLAQDITDVLNAQGQLAESEAKLRLILDNVDAYIFLKDTDGNYLFANQSVCDLWSTSLDEIIGKGDDSFFDPDATEIIRENDSRVLKHGETVRAEEMASLVDSDEVRIYRTTKIPLRDEEDAIYGLCGISIDVTERIEIEKALRISEQRFKVAGQAAYDLIYEWDVDNDRLSWFGDIDSILGFEPGEISHNLESWLGRIHPEDILQMSDAVELHRTSTQPIAYEYRIQHKQGHYLYWSDHALPLLNDENKPYRWIGVCTDITIQKQQQAELKAFAFSDKLTGLPNRALLSDRLRQAMQQDKRRGQRLAVLYLDLDGFKEINDTYGHATGDNLLIKLSQRFQRELRAGDTISRFGGDEFIAVLLDIESSSDALPFIQRLLDAASKPMTLNREVLQVSASVGITLYPQSEEVDADQLIRQADQAMYQAKLSGKNGYAFFDTEQDRSLRGQTQTIQRIERAIDDCEFELYYQPKVNMRTGEVIGCEALIRWNNPDSGLLLPGTFLPAITGSALSARLDEWVLDQALRQVSEWNALGLNLNVSVNIGGSLLQKEDFIFRLRALLDKYPSIQSKQLELEVLESSALQDIKLISRIMKECKKEGVVFSLDDFGTGYSSLAYLKLLPASILKIDRSFVQDMLSKPDDLAILEGIMGMSTAFRRDVVAEGVESLQQGILLLKLGCEVAQGFLIARPMKAEAVPKWLREWHVPEDWAIQSRSAHEDIPLLFAEIELREWVSEIDDYIATGEGELPPMSSKECRFGEWLVNAKPDSFSKDVDLDSIDYIHEQVHIWGHKACEHFQNKEFLEASEALTELHQQSNALINEIRSIQHKLT